MPFQSNILLLLLCCFVGYALLVACVFILFSCYVLGFCPSSCFPQVEWFLLLELLKCIVGFGVLLSKEPNLWRSHASSQLELHPSASTRAACQNLCSVKYLLFLLCRGTWKKRVIDKNAVLTFCSHVIETLCLFLVCVNALKPLVCFEMQMYILS